MNAINEHLGVSQADETENENPVEEDSVEVEKSEEVAEAAELPRQATLAECNAKSRLYQKGEPEAESEDEG